MIALAILLALQAAPATAASVPLRGPVVETAERLRPGEFIWTPEVSPAGPMLMVVNLKTQRAIIYRNGIPIGISTVSTGRPGHHTPAGVYVVLQKQAEHYSNLYDAAPMPFMQRLTWDGVALHGGHLPGYPASHGCIRLPLAFARLLYATTKLGMMVIVTRMDLLPPMAMTDAEVLSNGDGETLHWNPERAATGPLSVVISSADGEARVIRNGREIGAARVQVSGAVTQPLAYVRQADGTWGRLSLSEAGLADLAMSVAVDPVFRQHVLKLATPGTTVIITPDPLRADLASAAALLDGVQEP